MVIERTELLKRIAAAALVLRKGLQRSATDYHKAVDDVRWAESEINFNSERADLARKLKKQFLPNREMCLRVLENGINELERLALETAVAMPEVAKQLRYVTRSADELRSDRFANWDELERELASIEIEAIQLLNHIDMPPPGYGNYRRDKFIYDLRVAGETWKQIGAALKPHSEWEQLTERGVANAAITYAAKMGVSRPTNGKRGRPKKAESDTPNNMQ